MSGFLEWIKGVEPALAVLIAAIAVLAATLGTVFQQQRAVKLTRYEAVRRKRAIAKALKEEISAICDQTAPGEIRPAIFDANTSDLGRLNEESISSTIRFYATLQRSSASWDDVASTGRRAIEDLEAFLESTQPERDRLKRKLGVH